MCSSRTLNITDLQRIARLAKPSSFKDILFQASNIARSAVTASESFCLAPRRGEHVSSATDRGVEEEIPDMIKQGDQKQHHRA